MRLRSLVQVVAIVAICGAAGTTDRPYVAASSDLPQAADLQVAAADPTATVAPAVTVLPAVPGTAAVAYATGDPGAPSASAASALANSEPLPACGTGDALTPLSRLSDWGLTLVDSTYAVSADYVPDDLVSTAAAGLSRYFTVRSIMINDLRGMAKAAAAAGARLGIASGYRDYSTQIWTFWYWVHKLGYDQALQSSARPGHSEHQLGLAIDFATAGGEDPWTHRDFARETSAGIWLAANAWRYGFIMSYPRGKLAQTCYAYEPWHYRYVGAAEAAAVHSSGLTLREWLWRHQPNPEPLSPMSSPSPVSTGPPGVPPSMPPGPSLPASGWPAP